MLTEDQTVRLLDVLETFPDQDWANFAKVALLTGLRLSELFKLTWDDVDSENRTLTLRKPKGGKTVNLPISQDAVDVLYSLPILEGSPFVFPGKGGNQRTTFKRGWKEIRKAAGLPDNFRFHGLRHNFASQLASKGVPLAVIRDLMTHKDLSTTQRYAHLAPDALRKAVDKSPDMIKQTKAEVIPFPGSEDKVRKSKG
jgi:integrase